MNGIVAKKLAVEHAGEPLPGVPGGRRNGGGLPQWRWSQWLVPAAVLVVGCVLSLMVSVWARDDMRRAAELRFDTVADNATTQIERRFAAYLEVLSGVRALFNTGEVSRADFHRYAEALGLQRSFPGFQVLNYAPYVAADRKESFERSMRADAGLPDAARFQVTPAGVRDGYHPLMMVEPLPGNAQVLGKDIAASAAVRRSLELARDTGRLTGSGQMLKPQGDSGPVGLAVRLPVYHAGEPIDTVAQRRAAYQGSVGAGVSVNEMLQGLPGVDGSVRLRFFDGGMEAEPEGRVSGGRPAPASDKLLFDTGPAANATADAAEPAQAEADWRRVRTFVLAGRRWVVETSRPPVNTVKSWEDMVPTIILLGGTVISALLAGVVLSLQGSQRRAVGLAHDMTRSLRFSQQRLAEAQRLAKLGNWLLDPESGDIDCSPVALHVYGLDAGALPLTLERLLALVPGAQREALREAIDQAGRSDVPVEIEHPVVAGDGRERWVFLNLQQACSEQGAKRIRATVHDRTASRKSTVRLTLAHDIARKLAGEDEAESAIAYILSSIGMQMGWRAAICWTLTEDDRLECLQAWGDAGDEAASDFATVMRHWNAPRRGDLHIAVHGGNLHWRTIPARGAADERDRIAGRCGLHAALAVPLQAGPRPMALEFFSKAPIGADHETEGFMRSIGSQFAQYVQRRQAEAALRHLAGHDALTGLVSRHLLQERLVHAIQRAKRQNTRFAVVFMDLDRFKHINDSLGHSAGDLVLRACAERLRDCVRESDTVARFGGDEFVLVLDDLADAADAIGPVSKVLKQLGVPFDVAGRELVATASLGISMFPEDGQDPEALLMNADAAMYRAKEKGAGTYHFFSAPGQGPGHGQGPDRLVLESGLHRALERKELYLLYQPKLDLCTGAVTGVEALMRWRHPVLGMVSPVDFIPVAEESGLIDGFGQWALEVACRDARMWQDQGHPVQVSVNLSARQLNRPRLVQEVAQALAAAGLEAGRLELEITESGVMRKPMQAAAQLRELRALGVSLAIDDFGTGYSSLSYLQRFPLCTLKIDRSFVKDLPSDGDAAALTAGIIGLARSLRMKVVAEGVETLEQLAFLRTNRCDEIQGYFLSQPITADDMSRFLERDLRNLMSPTAAPAAVRA